jgi:hypothetical protein
MGSLKTCIATFQNNKPASIEQRAFLLRTIWAVLPKRPPPFETIMQHCRKCDFDCYSEYVMQLHYETAHVINGELAHHEHNNMPEMQSAAQSGRIGDQGNGGDMRGEGNKADA